MNPRVIDNDKNEITVTLDGRQLRGWSYSNDNERRQKMVQAREYVEGWCDGRASTREFPSTREVHPRVQGDGGADPATIIHGSTTDGTCEDRRIKAAGFTVCGSNCNRDWHWRDGAGTWHDGYRSEEAAVRAALAAIK